MSVVRASAIETEERKTGAPLVRTKDNFFSFFNKKKNKDRRKTPPKKPLDQDLPVADVGKLKSEESLRWSSKGKFPWSPGPGKKNPPLSMSTSSPRSSPTLPNSPQYGMKGRGRTHSTGMFFYFIYLFIFNSYFILILFFFTHSFSHSGHKHHRKPRRGPQPPLPKCLLSSPHLPLPRHCLQKGVQERQKALSPLPLSPPLKT